MIGGQTRNADPDTEQVVSRQAQLCQEIFKGGDDQPNYRLGTPIIAQRTIYPRMHMGIAIDNGDLHGIDAQKNRAAPYATRIELIERARLATICRRLRQPNPFGQAVGFKVIDDL